MVKRQRFTAEFKREAVRLLDAGERPASEVAIDLGIRRNQLYKWKAEQVRSGELSFPGSGRKPADQDSEIVRLKRELARMTEERDILKKVLPALAWVNIEAAAEEVGGGLEVFGVAVTAGPALDGHELAVDAFGDGVGDA